MKMDVKIVKWAHAQVYGPRPLFVMLYFRVRGVARKCSGALGKGHRALDLLPSYLPLCALISTHLKSLCCVENCLRQLQSPVCA